MLTAEEEAQLESLSPGDPRYSAYSAYKNLTPAEKKSASGIALLREAGVGPRYDPSQLATAAGITEQQARDFQIGRFGDTGTFNVGGVVNGPGTGTSDSIPAMLSDGEFVMTARAVDGAGGPATTTVRQAPYLEEYQEKLLELVGARGETPIDLPDYQVAGLDALTEEAIAKGQAGIGSFEPYLTTAGDALTKGQGILEGASGIVTDYFDESGAAARGTTGMYAPTEEALQVP